MKIINIKKIIINNKDPSIKHYRATRIINNDPETGWNRGSRTHYTTRGYREHASVIRRAAVGSASASRTLVLSSAISRTSRNR